MSTLPTPYKCIWCHKESPEATFKQENHVVPQCVGNFEQILPPGVVCDGCNNSFSRKPEKTLLNDPLFRASVVALCLENPRKKNAFRDRFSDDGPSLQGPPEKVDVKVTIEKGLRLRVDITYTTQDQPIPYPTIFRSYDRRQLGFLSRAIHKIAFESLAFNLYIKGSEKLIDVFSDIFLPVRLWARYGEPIDSVRPVLRRSPTDFYRKFEVMMWESGQSICVELDLFGDWYGVSLTSKPSNALADLRALVGPNVDGIWCISDGLFSLKDRSIS